MTTHWTVKKLTEHTGVCGSTLLYILMPAVNNVQDCCQVGTASLKLGATVDTL